MSSHHRMKKFNVVSENRSLGMVLFVWMMERKRPLISIVVLIAASFGTISFLSSQKGKMEKRSFAAYSAVNASDSAALHSFSEKYTHTAAGRMAILTLARMSFEAGKFDEVKTLLTPIMGDGRQSPQILRILAMEMMAKSYEATQNFEKSEKLYSKLSSMKLNPFKENHRLALALCFEKMGKRDEAKKIYDSMSDPTYENAEIRSKAKERLLGLAVVH